MATLHPGTPVTPRDLPESSTSPSGTNSSSPNSSEAITSSAEPQSSSSDAEGLLHQGGTPNRLRTQSSSYSGGSDSSSQLRGRKRSRQVNRWKATVRKERRNAGKSYVTKKGKEVSFVEPMNILVAICLGNFTFCCRLLLKS